MLTRIFFPRAAKSTSDLINTPGESRLDNISQRTVFPVLKSPPDVEDTMRLALSDFGYNVPISSPKPITSLNMVTTSSKPSCQKDVSRQEFLKDRKSNQEIHHVVGVGRHFGPIVISMYATPKKEWVCLVQTRIVIVFNYRNTLLQGFLYTPQSKKIVKFNS